MEKAGETQLTGRTKEAAVRMNRQYYVFSVRQDISLSKDAVSDRWRYITQSKLCIALCYTDALWTKKLVGHFC